MSGMTFLSPRQPSAVGGAAGTLIDSLKTVMRITVDDFDSELHELFSAAQSDLKLSGVTYEKVINVDDPLIRRAIYTYIKAHFGWDNDDHERLLRAYEMLKAHLTLSQEYTTEG